MNRQGSHTSNLYRVGTANAEHLINNPSVLPIHQRSIIMQKVYLRKSKTLDYPSRENAKILHFSLQDALPPGHSLAVNLAFGTLSYLVCDDSSTPRLFGQSH